MFHKDGTVFNIFIEYMCNGLKIVPTALGRMSSGPGCFDPSRGFNLLHNNDTITYKSLRKLIQLTLDSNAIKNNTKARQ